MAKKEHISETPATALLKANKVVFKEHVYEYLEHGGAQHSAQTLGFDPFMVVKSLVMQNQDAKPLLEALQAYPQLRTLHRPANLEDLFLKLTGRQIREDA